MIEDGENNDHQVVLEGGRDGYIYTFRGGATELQPPAGADGGVFAMSLGGANGSRYAARMHGAVGPNDGDFAGMGFNFTDPQTGFDASRYEGISFFARRGSGSAGRVRLKLPDANTSPDGGVCSECFNDFGADLELSEDWQRYVFRFDQLAQMPGWGAPRPGSIKADALFGVQFQIQEAGAKFDLWIDDLAFVGCGGESPVEFQSGEVPDLPDGLADEHNLIRNSEFEQGTVLPWALTLGPQAQAKVSIDDESACVRIDSPGDRLSDIQLRHRVELEAGHAYQPEFVARATENLSIRARVGSSGPPYVDYWASRADLQEHASRYVGTFARVDDASRQSELSFQFGGPGTPPGTTVCFDDVGLSDPEFTPPAAPASERAPKIRVNQVGYALGTPKLGVFATAQKDPLDWSLQRGDGTIALEGRSRVFGEDPASGEFLHHLDFTPVDEPGENFTLVSGDTVSPPFAIGERLYSGLRRDALRYFYYNRSGLPIEMPYAGNERWARKAGHPNDAKANCRKDSGCDYQLDVSGGWYDAGDHGKYVVNAGISVWTLLNLWENSDSEGRARLGDGTLDIPESENGLPDLLDEVRWELEWVLSMQVPAGRPHAGLAHHKIHEEAWTDLPDDPSDEKAQRYLHRPSTSAALNLAAVSAQAARVWRDLDPDFAKRCLNAAERAYAAALAEPDLLASSEDNVGGGPYDDKDLSDEFYWAAAELFVTTGSSKYARDLKSSKHFLSVQGPNADGVGAQSSMSWQQVASLGTASLALASSALSERERKRARTAILSAAQGYLKQIDAEGYPVPLSAGDASKYPWGSNSLVLNNMLVLGLAHQLTDEARYLNGMLQGMDYLLGRNPNAQSYVTGYGAYPLQNPHHRFWAAQKDPGFPPPPPGAVSGGPNSDLQDPYARAQGLVGCAPMRCFVDHIESWSTNEVAINWNAPLAWVAAYLDDHVARRTQTP